MRRPARQITIPLLTAAISSLLLVSCARPGAATTEDGRRIVTLWTSWAGTERAGIDAVIDTFNQSQDKVYVRSLNITDPQTKIMLATAGGNPPDIAIMSNQYIAPYVENNALTPLDSLCAAAGIDASQFVPVFWEAATYRGRIWALPLTSSVTTLHYNKRILREAGFDEPPKTLEELERMNDRIARRGPDGSLQRIGHLPSEPGWWGPEWSNWFGEGSFDGHARMRFDSAAWNDTANWLASYHMRFGRDELAKLRSGFGQFSSPQNPFFSGKVAMALQGIWMNRFIETFAPDDFEYGCAPFPSSEGSEAPYFAIADVDLAVIPAGAQGCQEAFVFMQYLASAEGIESLALAHGKLSSRKVVSPSFYDSHPHPYLGLFLEISKSGYARTRPQLAHFQSYLNEANEAISEIASGRQSPEDTLRALQKRQQAALDKRRLRWSRVADAYHELWSKEVARLERSQAKGQP